MIGAEDVKHALRGVEAGYLVALRRQAGGEHTGPTADVEYPRVAGRGAFLGHERHPFGEVVLDDVRGQRLVVFGGDPVEVLLAHRAGIVSAAAASRTADIASAAAG